MLLLVLLLEHFDEGCIEIEGAGSRGNHGGWKMVGVRRRVEPLGSLENLMGIEQCLGFRWPTGTAFFRGHQWHVESTVRHFRRMGHRRRWQTVTRLTSGVLQHRCRRATRMSWPCQLGEYGARLTFWQLEPVAWLALPVVRAWKPVLIEMLLTMVRQHCPPCRSRVLIAVDRRTMSILTGRDPSTRGRRVLDR